MRSKIIIFTFVISAGIAASGCGGSDNPPANVANANRANAANLANTAGDNTGLATTKTPEAAATNNAPTLAPVVHAYYDALKKKDAAGVRKVMGVEFLKSVEADMKSEDKTDIVGFLTEFDKLPETKMEVRNEQITGNRGVAEIKGGAYQDWAKLVFVNEGGSWKITNEVPK